VTSTSPDFASDRIETPRVRLHLVDAGDPASTLTAARIDAGLTVSELAAALHVSRPTVSMWERKDRAVARHYWPVLATALRLTEAQVAAFFTGCLSSRSDSIRLPALGRARRAAQLTQRGLAERLGVAPTKLAMWENARVPVTPETTARICTELAVDLADLVAEPPALPDARPLRQYRRAARMSRVEAAAHLRVSIGALARYEAGERRTPVRIVRRMARVYGRTVDEVLAHSGSTLLPLPAGRRWCPEELPLVLTALRTAAGLTKAGLGRAVGRSGQAVAGWEAGRSRPSPAMCRRLEVVFGLAAGRLPDSGSVAAAER
jgi:transcriptional regulator with XRE-family HTH domain